MGGDCIGSHLVPLSTGVDFVGAVVDVALGRQPDLSAAHEPAAAAVRFLFNEDDRLLLQRVRAEHPEFVQYVHLDEAALAEARQGAHEVTDSSTRLGHFIMSAPNVHDLAPYLPPELAGVASDVGAVGGADGADGAGTVGVASVASAASDAGAAGAAHAASATSPASAAPSAAGKAR